MTVVMINVLISNENFLQLIFYARSILNFILFTEKFQEETFSRIRNEITAFNAKSDSNTYGLES